MDRFELTAVLDYCLINRWNGITIIRYPKLGLCVLCLFSFIWHSSTLRLFGYSAYTKFIFPESYFDEEYMRLHSSTILAEWKM